MNKFLCRSQSFRFHSNQKSINPEESMPTKEATFNPVTPPSTDRTNRRGFMLRTLSFKSTASSKSSNSDDSRIMKRLSRLPMEEEKETEKCISSVEKNNNKRRFMLRSQSFKNFGGGNRRPMRRQSLNLDIEDSSIPFVPKNSVNKRIVKKFIECLNNHDVDGCNALFKSNDCEWRYSGEVHISIKQFGDMIQSIVDSFPDFHLTGDEAIEVGSGVVQIKNAVATGTHTGKAFEFQSYGSLPATGMKCINDPEHLTFFVRNEKIVQVHVLCTGQFCGPMGLHKQSKDCASQKSCRIAKAA